VIGAQIDAADGRADLPERNLVALERCRERWRQAKKS
jgi:hypothetical protein